MKKKIKCLCVVMALAMICSASAFAASYNFPIVPPYSGCIQYSSGVQRTSGTPYVSPSVAATPTTYVIVPEQNTHNFATNIITSVSTAGRRNFTYNSGYGGTGHTYYLAGHSTERSFLAYTVRGTWNP